MTAGILLSGQANGDWVELSAAGSWTAEYAGAIEPQVEAVTRSITARGIAININRIEYLDTYGAWLIERALRNWTTQGARGPSCRVTRRLSRPVRKGFS